MSYRDRSTGEMLVLMVGLTVCGFVVVSSTVLLWIFFKRPEADVSTALRNIGDIINTMIGLLAGFLAGRTDVMMGDKSSSDTSKSSTSKDTDSS